MRVIVGLSGGVDSAVAALLLKRQGHEVSGLFMKNWDDDDRDGYCPAEEDYASARAVSEALEIPLHRVNFAQDYKERVFQAFLAEHRRGRTPNPDILCNKEIKFRSFLEHALTLGAERVATGHYARLTPVAGGERLELRKAQDASKDQTYFLATLAQHQLARALFPLGSLLKAEVRALARAAGLPNHDRKDSTGICFIGARDFRGFLERYLPPQPGDIEDVEGVPRGRHAGLMYYTIGQRHGLGIGGAGAPWYVVDKRTADNVLVVAQGDHPQLYATALVGGAMSWISGAAPDLPLPCRARIRYRQEDQGCVVTGLPEGRFGVSFTAPQRAVTPGQSVVLYDGEVCLGAGVIEQAGALHQALDSPP